MPECALIRDVVDGEDGPGTGQAAVEATRLERRDETRLPIMGMDDVRLPGEEPRQGQDRLAEHGEAPGVVVVIVVGTGAVDARPVEQFVAGQQIDLHALPFHQTHAHVMIDATRFDGHGVGQPGQAMPAGDLEGGTVTRDGDLDVMPGGGQGHRQRRHHVGQASGLDEGRHLAAGVEDAQAGFLGFHGRSPSSRRTLRARPRQGDAPHPYAEHPSPPLIAVHLPHDTGRRVRHGGTGSEAVSGSP